MGRRAAKIVGRERVAAGIDCGFARRPFIRRVAHDSMGKTETLAEGAQRATAELW